MVVAVWWTLAASLMEDHWAYCEGALIIFVLWIMVGHGGRVLSRSVLGPLRVAILYLEVDRARLWGSDKSKVRGRVGPSVGGEVLGAM